jgi:uncharacterized membrane protein
MNIILWILQVLLTIGFLIFGVTHAFRFEWAKEQSRMKWVTAVPRRLLTFIGLFEILGAVGLILPALTGVLPWLTPLAALLIAVMMLLAAGFHIARREYPNMVFNFIRLALAAFVAYGRWALVPL